jgi:poly-gamma-glutamate capsule biosynthesis protein CapA/YwtB (metallophosphatase superfamily)
MPTLALAGDTMLGRGVADALRADRRVPLVSAEVAAHIDRADAFVLNLECCISNRGTPFPDPRKPFFFRAPPVAAERLKELGVDAVTLANNHALDFGHLALLDTIHHLNQAGIRAAGAGANEALAKAPQHVQCGDVRIRLVALADHPRAFAAAADRPGIAFVDLHDGLADWVAEAAQPGADCDVVLVAPHWGPNMVAEPTTPVRNAARALREARATLIAGHSAHVFQGVAAGVLFDLGDFLDDYAVSGELRNDLGLLWLVELSSAGVQRLSALPLALDYCFTRLAAKTEREWIVSRLRELCAPFQTRVRPEAELIDIQWTS